MAALSRLSLTRARETAIGMQQLDGARHVTSPSPETTAGNVGLAPRASAMHLARGLSARLAVLPLLASRRAWTRTSRVCQAQPALACTKGELPHSGGTTILRDAAVRQKKNSTLRSRRWGRAGEGSIEARPRARARAACNLAPSTRRAHPQRSETSRPPMCGTKTRLGCNARSGSHMAERAGTNAARKAPRVRRDGGSKWRDARARRVPCARQHRGTSSRPPDVFGSLLSKQRPAFCNASCLF
jgi:hypothetical protein